MKISFCALRGRFAIGSAIRVECSLREGSGSDAGYRLCLHGPCRGSPGVLLRPNFRVTTLKAPQGIESEGVDDKPAHQLLPEPVILLLLHVFIGRLTTWAESRSAPAFVHKRRPMHSVRTFPYPPPPPTATIHMLL